MSRHFESGQVMPLIALCLSVLMGFGGMAVDVGFLLYQHRQQQTATDAAALAAARQLIATNCANTAAVAAAADTDAADNGFTNGVGNVTVTVTNPPPAGGPYAGNACAAQVQIARKAVQTFFTRLFGFANGMAETTQAIAQASGNSQGCVYLLSTTTASIFNGDTWTGPSCSVLMNDTATFNGDSKFQAPYIGYAGGAPIENGSTFTAATPAPMLPVADPCPEIAGCSGLAANPPATSNCNSVTYNGLSSVTIPSGCYNSIVVNGCQNVTFQSGGTFVFNGTTIFNGAQNVSGSGVTLYVTANGTPPTFNGIPSISLSPPTTGSSAGVLYYQVPQNGQSPIFNRVSSSISGLIYAPGATNAIFNGTSGGYVVIVVGAATFNGSASYDFASPPPNGAFIRKGILGE